MPNSNLRVVIYCRVARADQLAIKNQESYLRTYAEMKSYSCPISYVDCGSGLNFERPAFSRLNHDIQAGKIDVLITRDISRIGRDMVKVEKWLAGISKYDVKLIVTDHQYKEESTQTICQAIKNIFAVV